VNLSTERTVSNFTFNVEQNATKRQKAILKKRFSMPNIFQRKHKVMFLHLCQSYFVCESEFENIDERMLLDIELMFVNWMG